VRRSIYFFILFKAALFVEIFEKADKPSLSSFVQFYYFVVSLLENHKNYFG
jgi:hypothetical protein